MQKVSLKNLVLTLCIGLCFIFSTSAHAGKKHKKVYLKKGYPTKVYYKKKVHVKHHSNHRRHGGGDDDNQQNVNVIDNGVKRDCREVGRNLICN